MVIIGTAYHNCEFRRFTFTEDSTEGEAHLREIGGTATKKERPLGVHAHLLHEIEEVENAN